MCVLPSTFFYDVKCQPCRNDFVLNDLLILVVGEMPGSARVSACNVTLTRGQMSFTRIVELLNCWLERAEEGREKCWLLDPPFRPHQHIPTMSTPYPTRSRLSRSSMSTPNRGLGAGTFALSNSPSTPYDIYNQRNHSPHSFSSPRSSSAFLPPSTSQSTVAYRKSTVFGSPGVGRSPRFSQGVGTSTPTATPRSSNGPFNTLVSRTPKFIRRKTFKQR
jgi:hypothetical protein